MASKDQLFDDILIVFLRLRTDEITADELARKMSEGNQNITPGALVSELRSPILANLFQTRRTPDHKATIFLRPKVSSNEIHS
jgi:hypothetical protein